MTPLPHRLFEQSWPEGEYRLFQLGFVVDDLLGTAMRWATVFAVGPFHVLPRIESPCTYRGTASAVDVQIAAMIHCLPYIGFPRALNAIRAINQLPALD